MPKRKRVDSDFQKRKKKVGGKKVIPQNETRVDTKSRSIYVGEQSVVAGDKKGKYVTQRNLNLEDLFVHLNHYNANMRKEGLAGMLELFSTYPQLLNVHISNVLERSLVFLCDDDADVRKALLNLVDYIFRTCTDARIAPLSSLIATFFTNAMTHLDPQIRMDGIHALSSLVQFRIAVFRGDVIGVLLPILLTALNATKKSQFALPKGAVLNMVKSASGSSLDNLAAVAGSPPSTPGRTGSAVSGGGKRGTKVQRYRFALVENMYALLRLLIPVGSGSRAAKEGGVEWRVLSKSHACPLVDSSGNTDGPTFFLPLNGGVQHAQSNIVAIATDVHTMEDSRSVQFAQFDEQSSSALVTSLSGSTLCEEDGGEASQQKKQKSMSHDRDLDLFDVVQFTEIFQNLFPLLMDVWIEYTPDPEESELLKPQCIPLLKRIAEIYNLLLCHTIVLSNRHVMIDQSSSIAEWVLSVCYDPLVRHMVGCFPFAPHSGCDTADQSQSASVDKEILSLNLRCAAVFSSLAVLQTGRRDRAALPGAVTKAALRAPSNALNPLVHWEQTLVRYVADALGGREIRTDDDDRLVSWKYTELDAGTVSDLDPHSSDLGTLLHVFRQLTSLLNERQRLSNAEDKDALFYAREVWTSFVDRFQLGGNAAKLASGTTRRVLQALLDILSSGGDNVVRTLEQMPDVVDRLVRPLPRLLWQLKAAEDETSRYALKVLAHLLRYCGMDAWRKRMQPTVDYVLSSLLPFFYKKVKVKQRQGEETVDVFRGVFGPFVSLPAHVQREAIIVLEMLPPLVYEYAWLQACVHSVLHPGMTAEVSLMFMETVLRRSTVERVQNPEVLASVLSALGTLLMDPWDRYHGPSSNDPDAVQGTMMVLEDVTATEKEACVTTFAADMFMLISSDAGAMSSSTISDAINSMFNMLSIALGDGISRDQSIRRLRVLRFTLRCSAHVQSCTELPKGTIPPFLQPHIGLWCVQMLAECSLSNSSEPSADRSQRQAAVRQLVLQAASKFVDIRTELAHAWLAATERALCDGDEVSSDNAAGRIVISRDSLQELYFLIVEGVLETPGLAATDASFVSSFVTRMEQLLLRAKNDASDSLLGIAIQGFLSSAKAVLERL